MANEYYVYQYLTNEGVPYYIGKGKGNRMHVDHKHILLPDRDKRVVIEAGLTNSEAKALEGELITKYGRKVDGGILDNIKINQWACHDGWKHSEEAIEKIRKGNLGKVRTEEHKAHYRGPKTKYHAENISKAVSNLWADPAYKAKRMEKVMQTRKQNGFSK
jgi:hypothetical protein